MTNAMKYGKSDREKKLDADRQRLLNMRAEVKEREKKITSRQFIRDASLQEMKLAKDECEKLAREADILERNIKKREYL